jgi:hypothetical protein
MVAHKNRTNRMSALKLKPIFNLSNKKVLQNSPLVDEFRKAIRGLLLYYPVSSARKG